MDTHHVDVAVLGAGTAGLGAFAAARRHTDNVLLIERGPHGTTCARVGCMPSKLLIAAADAAHHTRQAETFGIQAGDLRIDGRAVMARIKRERDRFVESVLGSVERIPPAQRVEGTARFANEQTVVIDEGLRIVAERFVIATGSRPSVVPFLEAAEDRLLVNDSLFELDDLPESVAVFGPGVIGLELGQALSRLGVRVRMFGIGGAVGPIHDDAVRECARATFNAEFPLDPDAEVTDLSREGDGVTVSWKDPGRGDVSESFSHVLAATGRRANVDGLQLKNTGLDLDDRGVPIHDPHTLQCGNAPIFIAGDVNDRLQILHEASDEGRIAGSNAGTYPDVRAGLRRTPLAIVFTDPQIAAVGLNITEIAERCPAGFAVGEVDFGDQGRSRVMARNRGLLRVYGEQGTGLFLGAEMFGPAAEHIGHLLAWAAQQRMSVSAMLSMPFYHPVIEEGLRTALRELNHHLRVDPKMVEQCMECGPGA